MTSDDYTMRYIGYDSIQTLSNSHNIIVLIQKIRGDIPHSVIVALLILPKILYLKHTIVANSLLECDGGAKLECTDKVQARKQSEVLLRSIIYLFFH